MDIKKSSKGVTKILKNEKQMLRYPQCHSVDQDKPFFKVEENDFPSLSEVSETNPKTEKDSSACGASLFTYSSKLKTLPVEGSVPSSKFENVQPSERPSKVESTLNRTNSGRHLVQPLLSVPSNHQSSAKQSSSSVHDIVPTSNKKLLYSKPNSSFLAVKSKKSEYSNEATNRKTSYEQKSGNDKRSPQTAPKESSTLEKIVHSSRKGYYPNSTSATAQKSLINNSLSSPRKINTEYSSVLRSYNKESDKPNINAQYKRLDEANRSVRSKESGQSFGLFQNKVMHGNVSINSSNKPLIASSQMAYNSVKPGNNKTLSQSSSVQSSKTGTVETKKKKKRKSKLKRQAALQTGKILVLTPEVHSKIVGQSNNVSVQKNQNILMNINDNDEYPELGTVKFKTTKDSQGAVTTMHIKEENSTNLVVFESETDIKKNLLVSKDSSANNLEVETKSEERNIGPIENAGGEKPAIHSNNPITLSLFDMLVTAKPRKKESEKKDESTDENNSSKVLRKEMIKKSVPQAVNPLASSKLTIKRGKEREKPKIKRPSRMRKLILMERQLRKENMAMKQYKAEERIQEKSEEIFPKIKISHDSSESSAHENFETCVQALENDDINPKIINETSDCIVLNFDFNNQTSEHLELNCKDTDSQSTLKSLANFCDQSKPVSDIMNNANHSVINPMPNIDNNGNEIISVSNSILEIGEDLVSMSASDLTDKEKNLREDLVDINKVENFAEICSSNIKNPSKTSSDLKSGISDTCCINGILLENLEEMENGCQTDNFTNRMQDLVCKTNDIIENIVSTVTEININLDCEFNSEKKSGSTETKTSNGNLDSCKEIISNTSANLFSDEERLKATKLMLHSRKFRQYCNHFISKEIDQAVFSLIDDLARFQDRMYQKDPVKAKIRRRLVYGIKEIKKHMKLKKVKCIIIATDIEDIKIEGGLNDSLGELISLAEAYQIPCIFSHWRFSLGKVCRKSVPVSCVGIFNYEGSEKNFKKMVELHDDSKHDYLEVTKQLASELTSDQVKELFEAEKKSTIFLREVSQRILREKVYYTPEGYRSNEALEQSANIESEDSAAVPREQSECSNLLMSDANSPSYPEYSDILKKLDKNNLIQHKDTDINTILAKYKVVKEC